MESNLYSNGQQQAEVTQAGIDAAWGHGDNCGDRIKVLNAAFRRYYRYRQRIEQVSRIDWDASWSMWKELEDAGDTGWGSGVQDLDDAFRHLIENGGRWKDDGVKHYWGICQPSVYRLQVFDAPRAASNFLSAVNAKLAKLSELAADHQVAQSRAVAGNASRNWEMTRDALQDVKDVAEKVKPFLWILPKQVTTAEWYEHLGNILGAVDKAIDILFKADSGLQTYVAGRQAGMGSGAAAAWAGLGQVLSYLPVLGSFYAEIVNQTPGLVASVRSRFENAHRTWERAASGATTGRF